MPKLIGIFGGTFDPIHLGHLELAEQAYQQCQLQQVCFMPCYQSPTKRNLPVATGPERLAMLEIAIKDHEYFCTDDREIVRGGMSYMVDSLKSLRQEYPEIPLCLIMSMDAFAALDKWYHWQELITLAHLVVANRPESRQISDPVAELLQQHQVFQADKLQETTAGYIFYLQIPPNPISATQIRSMIKAGQEASSMVKPAVWNFIMQHKLYKDQI